MKIDKTILDELTAKAKTGERLRMNLDMRTSSDDTSQRMLNALEPGTIVPIHRHCFTAETVIIVRGKVKEIFYDDNGNVTEEVGIAIYKHLCSGLCGIVEHQLFAGTLAFAVGVVELCLNG